MNLPTRCLIFAACLAHLPAHSAGDRDAHARLEASHATLQSAERDYLSLRSSGALSNEESADYQLYLAQLRRRFAAACAEVLTDLRHPNQWQALCYSQTPVDTQAAAIDQNSERTRLERTGALTRDLDAALGDFDEMLLTEQERVKAATPPQAAGASGSATQGAGRTGTGHEGLGDPSADGTREDSGQLASREDSELPGGAETGQVDDVAGRSGGQGGGRHVAVQSVPRDIPDGSDDDVVARQLREAAQKERDPELRARLWEEYRRYKQGTP